MRDVTDADFVGKTVESIDTECINVIKFSFKDGTKLELFAEIGGPYGLPYFWIPSDDEEEEESEE